MRYARWTLGLALVAAVAAAGTVQAQGDAVGLLKYVPREAEVVVGINVRQVAGSPAFAELRARLDETKRIDAAVNIIGRLTGVNVLEDLEAVVFASTLGDQAPGVAIFKGTWDTQNLVELAALNPTYAKSTVHDRDVHYWKDERSGKPNHAVFLADDVLAISEQGPVIGLVIQTAADPSRALSNSDKLEGIPGLALPTSAFVAAFRPANNPKVTNHPALGRLESVVMRAQVEAEHFKMSAVIESQDADSAVLFRDVMNGLIAMGRLHDNMLVPWETDVSSEASRVQVSLTAPTASIINAIENKHRLAQAAQMTP